MPHQTTLVAVAISILFGLITGCRPRDQIRTYRVAKAPEAQPSASPSAPARKRAIGEPTDRMIGAIYRGPDRAWFFKAVGPRNSIDAVAEAINALLSGVRFDGPEPTWVLPNGWRTGEPRPMRLATILAPTAGSETELTVIGLPLVGDWKSQVLDNVNRWRGQLALEPVTAESLRDSNKPIEGSGVDAVMFDEKGWFESGPMTGPFASASGSPKPPAPPRPPEPQLVDQAPEGWTKKPGSALRKASYTTPDDAEVTGFAFPAAGQMGDELANVNRWRREVGLPETTAEELAESREVIALLGDDSGSFFTLAGPEETTYAAMSVQDGMVWFFKLRGPSQAADAQSDTFRAWLASLRLSQ